LKATTKNKFLKNWCRGCDGLFVYGLETMKGLSYLEQIDRWMSISARKLSFK